MPTRAPIADVGMIEELEKQMRTVIYANSGDFRQFKALNPAACVAMWLNSLPSSTHEGKQIREVVYFQTVKDGGTWHVYALVELI